MSSKQSALHPDDLVMLEQAKAFILYLLNCKVERTDDFVKCQRIYYRENRDRPYLAKDVLLQAYRYLLHHGEIKSDSVMEQWLVMKRTRSQSGIVVVSILTKPYNCPGNCLYCPTEKDIPKSYLAMEPAVMRAISCKYDPFIQVVKRLDALYLTGHPVSKVNIRVIGGTFSYYPKRYQTWFIRRTFEACNVYSAYINRSSKDWSLSFEQWYKLNVRVAKSALIEVTGRCISPLSQAQEINEECNCRIVEISVETRQDYINSEELKRLRNLGVTKVELGVQSIYEEVLKLNRRGHGIAATIDATRLLREAGFKVAYQIMLNLPGSDYERDKKMMLELFSNPNFKPDHLKIYPLALVREADIYHWYLSGKFKPYNTTELTNLLADIKQNIPYYCRIERVIRDIPADYIVEGGAKVSNLRQDVHALMLERGTRCNCIRCREVGNNLDAKGELIAGEPVLFKEEYEAGNGKEVFLSYESSDRLTLYSFLRLRINRHSPINILNNVGLVREVHTYGDQLAVGFSSSRFSAQHRGLGKKLMREAELITQKEGLKKMAVIAGVGVRGYFRKQGYELKQTYMVKAIK